MNPSPRAEMSRAEMISEAIEVMEVMAEIWDKRRVVSRAGLKRAVRCLSGLKASEAVQGETKRGGVTRHVDSLKPHGERAEAP